MRVAHEGVRQQQRSDIAPCPAPPPTPIPPPAPRRHAGQSMGAWLCHGITLELEGDANDYVAKVRFGAGWGGRCSMLAAAP